MASMGRTVGVTGSSMSAWYTVSSVAKQSRSTPCAHPLRPLRGARHDARSELFPPLTPSANEVGDREGVGIPIAEGEDATLRVGGHRPNARRVRGLRAKSSQCVPQEDECKRRELVL